MKGISITTTSTFTTENGTVVSYNDIFESIFKNVISRGLSEEDQKDIFQQAAFKAVRSHGTYDPRRGAQPKTWGSRITDNCVKDHYSSASRRGLSFSSLEGADDGDGFLPEEIIGSYRGDEFEADICLRCQEAKSYILDGINSLSETYREVITLKIGGLKDNQIAKALGWKPEKVHMTFFRAKKALARKLGSEFLAEHGFAA